MANVTLLSKEQKQFRANLHCHSTNSDGKLTPEQLRDAYRERGYDVLAITDHCIPCAHNDLTTDDFLMLTGYEAYIRPHPLGKHNAFKPEVHLNLFARDPENETLICYNAPYIKYLPVEEHDKLKRAGSERQREFTTEYINEFIATAKENGYIVSYNHPYWSMESEAQILSYEGCFSLEMYNTSSFTLNHIEGAEALYDTMLRKGKRMGCHAGDDNHNKAPFDSRHSDSFGWYTMILADELEYGKVFDSLASQNCYASNGPRINEIRVYDTEEGKKVHVECSPASDIFVFFGSKSPKHALVEDNEEPITSFDFDLHPKAKFIRVSVYDKEGRVANSRGYFPDEWTVEE